MRLVHRAPLIVAETVRLALNLVVVETMSALVSWAVRSTRSIWRVTRLDLPRWLVRVVEPRAHVTPVSSSAWWSFGSLEGSGCGSLEDSGC